MRSLTAVLAAALVLLPATPALAANAAPVAVDDAVTYRNSGGIDYLVPALANDSDPDGDTLTYTAVTPATKGNAYLLAGKLYYKPFLGNTGTDSFTYTVTDGQGNTATGTVTATLWVDPSTPNPLVISIAAPGSATLAWPATERAAEYRIYRNQVLVASTAGLTWTDSGLLDTAWHDYRVAAANGGGFEGLLSNAVYRYPRASTPTDLVVDVTGDPATLSLTWNGLGKSGPWRVFRDGVLVATTAFPKFEDTGLVTGRGYGYQVQLVGPVSTAFANEPSLLSAEVRGTPAELSAIGRLFWDLGGSGGDLGPVTTPERAIPGGRQQDHQNGIILQQDGGTPFSVTGSFRTAFTGAGGATGDLGFPLMQVECDFRDTGCGQQFEGGSIWSSASTPTRVVRLVIEGGWAAIGWQDGWLGYPVGDQGTLSGGVWQEFEDGAVYWSAATGSHGVSGWIGEFYESAGGPAGSLRYPTTDEDCGIIGGGCYQLFQGGTVYWSPATGTHRVFGAIGETYARHGSESGGLGLPITGENCGLRGGGCYQLFRGGSIYWSPAGGAHRVHGAIRDAWARKGLENGGLGYPVTDENCYLRGGGCYQLFQGGSIYWSPATGANVVLGAIRDAWARKGLENGGLGYPTTAEICGLVSGGCYQLFQGGAIYWSPATGANPVYGAIRDAFVRAGSQNGLGYPVTGEICGLRAGGCYQLFQRGSVYWSPATGANRVNGGIRDAWAAQGLENGRLGYPISEEKFVTGSWQQTFQGGWITIRPAGTTVGYW